MNLSTAYNWLNEIQNILDTYAGLNEVYVQLITAHSTTATNITALNELVESLKDGFVRAYVTGEDNSELTQELIALFGMIKNMSVIDD